MCFATKVFLPTHDSGYRYLLGHYYFSTCTSRNDTDGEGQHVLTSNHCRIIDRSRGNYAISSLPGHADGPDIDVASATTKQYPHHPNH